MPKHLILLISVVLFLQAAVGAQGKKQDKKEEVLDLLERSFGKPLDTQSNLYEVNDLFVIYPRFAPNGGLEMMKIVPKYFLNDEHPEWEEPDEMPLLSRTQYDSTISKVVSIKPFGSLLSRYWDPYITNSTHYRYEYYENVDLNYLESGGTTDKERVRAIYLSFLHPVTGTIVGKKFGRFHQVHRFLACTESSCYYVSEATFRNLTKHSPTTFSGIVARDYVTLGNFGKKPKSFRLKSSHLKVKVKKEKFPWAN